jgi:hypothetical protein
MARANVTWGEERIAAELRLKLGLNVSPRTVRRYMARGGRVPTEKAVRVAVVALTANEE